MKFEIITAPGIPVAEEKKLKVFLQTIGGALVVRAIDSSGDACHVVTLDETGLGLNMAVPMEIGFPLDIFGRVRVK